MKNLLLATTILLVSQISFAVVDLPSAICKVELKKFNYETRRLNARKISIEFRKNQQTTKTKQTHSKV